MAVLAMILLFAMLQSGEAGEAVPVHAKEFVIGGTVDCGRASGQRCEVFPTVTVWTTDLSGNREKVQVDLSWVLSQLDSYDQDDPICLVVQSGAAGSLQAVGVQSSCNPAPPPKKTPEKDKVQAPQDNPPTPTPTGTPVPTSTPTPTPTRTPSADLSLTKDLDSFDCPEGCEFIFTVTVRNAGPDTATGVRVADIFDDSFLFLNDATVSQGAFDFGTNVWDVGSIPMGGSATLTLQFSGGFSAQNTAEVIASDLPDPDSTPNNQNPAEDDQATDGVSITSEPGGPSRRR